MKVINEITIYEIDGNPSSFGDGSILRIESHWNEKSKVILRLKDYPSITVNGDDLILSIHNVANRIV